MQTMQAMRTLDFQRRRLVSFFIILMLLAQPQNVDAQKLEVADVWFGTMKLKGDKLAKGIYHATLGLDDGAMVDSKLAIELESPGFLCANPNPALEQTVIYATTKVGGKDVIASLKVNDDKTLSIINSVPISEGDEKAGGACHVAIDATGTLLVSTQYGSGTAAVFAVDEDGSLKERTQLIKHTGGSRVVGKRQNSPHAHYCGFDNDNRFAFVCDLGLDRVEIYRIDAQEKKLVAHGNAICEPGGGPRHMKFHPAGKHAFVLNELAMSVSVFDYDAQAGAMKLKQTVKTISDETKDHEVFNSASEIVVHPSGKFVYTGNRGNDTISVFAFEENSGTLERIQIEPIRGAWPRNFNLAPGGQWLIAAGRDSNTAASFKIDAATGKLTHRLRSLFVPHPICVLFTQPASR